MCLLPTLTSLSIVESLDNRQNMDTEDCAHASQGAEGTVVVKRKAKLIKMPCVLDTDPVDLELVCHARQAIWLEASPLELFNAVKIPKPFQMAPQRIVVTYPNESEIPMIEDVGVAAMKAFLEDAKKVTADIEKLKINLKKVTQGFENETLMDIEKEDKKNAETVDLSVEGLMLEDMEAREDDLKH